MATLKANVQKAAADAALLQRNSDSGGIFWRHDHS